MHFFLQHECHKTDFARQDQSILSRFDTIIEKTFVDEIFSPEQNEASSSIILAMAKVGHYSQSYDLFLHWNVCNFKRNFMPNSVDDRKTLEMDGATSKEWSSTI
jgi:hypothetical protein